MADAEAAESVFDVAESAFDVSGRLSLRPVKTAYAQVADQLRDMILGGQLTPGDKLPIESELTELFGVSRSTIREALRVLGSQQLITTKRGVGGGSFVAEPNVVELGQQLEANIGLLAGLEKVTVDDLLEARVMLEVPAAGLAAQRRTAEHLQLMEASAGTPGHRPRPDLHMQFHRIVLDAAGNKLLGLMTNPVFRVLRERFLRDAAPRQFWHRVRSDHQAIAEAIRASDAERAESLMAEHLGQIRETYLSIEKPGIAHDPNAEADD